MISLMDRRRFSYFEVVRVEPRAGSSRELEALRGRTGAVMGWSNAEGSDWPTAYAVAIDGLDETWMIDIASLVSTGELRTREDYFDGSSIRVSPAGEPLGYPVPGGSEDGEPIEVRAHRGSKRASVHRELVLSERQFDDLVEIAREHGADAVAGLDPYQDGLDKAWAEAIAAELRALRPARPELQALIDQLTAVIDFCVEADGDAWISIHGP
jgi:Immunity protein 31